MLIKSRFLKIFKIYSEPPPLCVIAALSIFPSGYSVWKSRSKKDNSFAVKSAVYCPPPRRISSGAAQVYIYRKISFVLLIVWLKYFVDRQFGKILSIFRVFDIFCSDSHTLTGLGNRAGFAVAASNSATVIAKR